MRTFPLVAAALLACALSAGCKRAVKCYGVPESDDLYRMEELLNKGVDVCPEHLRPVIVAGPAGVTLNARGIATELPRGSIRRIDALHRELRQARETWKQVHPGLAFEPLATVQLQGELGATSAASVLASTAYAGYPRLRVAAGSMTVEFSWAVPGPPRPYDEPQPRALYVRRTAEGWHEVRLQGSSRGTLARDVATVLAAIDEVCAAEAGACANILELDVQHGSALEAVALVQQLFGHPRFSREKPSVRFTAAGSTGADLPDLAPR
jgi:hypothetical protein